MNKHDSFIYTEFPFWISVPSSISGITVNNFGRTAYLSISWLPAIGYVDAYVVTLSHHGNFLPPLILSKAVTECSFSSLTPGRLYNVTVTTRSGKYENYSFSQEWTGKRKDFLGLHSWNHDPVQFAILVYFPNLSKLFLMVIYPISCCCQDVKAVEHLPVGVFFTGIRETSMVYRYTI